MDPIIQKVQTENTNKFEKRTRRHDELKNKICDHFEGLGCLTERKEGFEHQVSKEMRRKMQESGAMSHPLAKQIRNRMDTIIQSPNGQHMIYLDPSFTERSDLGYKNFKFTLKKVKHILYLAEKQDVSAVIAAFHGDIGTDIVNDMCLYTAQGIKNSLSGAKMVIPNDCSDEQEEEAEDFYYKHEDEMISMTSPSSGANGSGAPFLDMPSPETDRRMRRFAMQYKKLMLRQKKDINNMLEKLERGANLR